MNMSWVWQQMNEAALQKDQSMVGELEEISQAAWWERESKARNPEREVIPFSRNVY